MKNLRNLRFLPFLFAFCLALTTAAAEKVQLGEKPVVMAISAERRGNFLLEPGNVPIEFLRRVGREINKNWPAGKASFQAASIFSLAEIKNKDFLKPRPFIDLSSEQKKDAQALLDRYSSEARNLLEEIKPEKNCFYFYLAAETDAFGEALARLAENDQSAGKLKPAQVSKIKDQLLPVLQASDYIIGAAALSSNGFEARLRICSNEKKLANPKIDHSLSVASFLNPSSLMVFAQTHAIEDPAELMKRMQSIPQTATVVSMVASAGLDFEKDILANSAHESILYLNLEPDEESGVPDIRFVAPVPDMQKLKGNLDKFKTLCMQTGIFIKPGEENFVRLSHFMFPQYGVFAGLFDRFLILASSQRGLEAERDFLKQASEGKAQREEIDQGLQRYWRISFADFNLQLQKLLQSPLLVDKGIPPVPNLNFLDDLEDLLILTRLKPEYIDFSILLPIKEVKEK